MLVFWSFVVLVLVHFRFPDILLGLLGWESLLGLFLLLSHKSDVGKVNLFLLLSHKSDVGKINDT